MRSVLWHSFEECSTLLICRQGLYPVKWWQVTALALQSSTQVSIGAFCLLNALCKYHMTLPAEKK